MKIKFYLMLSIFILFFSIACVSASENTNLTDIQDMPNDYGLGNSSSVFQKEWYVDGSKSNDGDGSDSNPFNNLKSSINKSNDGDTIYIAPGNYNGLKNVNLTINKKLNLINWGSGDVIFDGENNYRIFNISASSFNIKGLTFVQGNSIGNGGLLYFENGLKNSKIEANFINSSAVNGGAIYFNDMVENNTFTGSFIQNNAIGDGGAIYLNDDSKNNLWKLLCEENKAASNGGVFYFNGNSTKDTFEGNYVRNKGNGRWGGVFYFFGYSDYNVYSGNFSYNYAKLWGAALYANNHSSHGIYSGNFIGNYIPEGSGAGLTFDWDVSNSVFSGNFSNNYVHEFVGAALEVSGEFKNNVISGYFENNTESAIILGKSYNNTINGTFINNYGRYCGAIGLEESINDNFSAIFINNKVSEKSGGAISITTNVINTTFGGMFINNSAKLDGGAIAIYAAFNPYAKYIINFTVNGKFINNSAGRNGGAIFIDSSSKVALSNIAAIFDYNHAKKGGAIYLNASDSHINSFVFNNNDARDGGAIYFTNNATVTQSNFTNNAVKHYGGAIYIGDCGIVNKCNFINNSANFYGAGVYFNTNAIVSDSNFDNNRADISGGGIYSGNNVDVDNCSFNSNYAYDGGALNSIGQVTVNNSEFMDNSGVYAGAIHFKGIGIVDSSNFTNNIAINNEGGAILSDISVTVDKSNFTNNRALNKGGAIFTYGKATIEKSDFINNSATYGGACYILNNTVVINNCAFNDNATEYSEIFFEDGIYQNELNKNWWGSNNPDWEKLINTEQIPSSYAVLNVSANPSEISASEKSTITTNFVWNGTNTDATSSLPLRNIKLSSDGGYLSETAGYVGLTSEFSSKTERTYIVNATVDNEIISIPIELTGSAPKDNLTLKATAKPITIGENATIIITNFEKAIGKVSVDAGNGVYFASINKGTAIAIVPGLNANTTAIIKYPGDDNYNPASTTVEIVVNSKGKENATITIDAPEITEGENATITVTLPEDATGKITIGNEIITVINGTANTVLINLPVGNTTVPVTYSGDEKYNPIETNVTVIVKETTSDIIITAPDVNKYYNGPERFTVKVTDSKRNPLTNKSVTIKINGVTYTRTTDTNGSASIALGLVAGVYDVNVTVDNQTVYSVVTILPTVNGTDIVKIFKNGTQYYATFLDSNGKYLTNETNVRFNINGVLYDRKVSGDKGLAKLNINLEQGEYVITAINLVTGDMATNNITVLPLITENKNIIKYYKNATQYTVKLLGEDCKTVGAGKTVKFNINGVFYERQTNESEIAKLNINLNPGSYIITAEYNGCSVSNIITVLPVLYATDIAMKYGDQTQFKVNLLDGQGKAYANQNITFNINGVFYNRTTDDLGISKLNINLMPGEYIITSSFNGSSIANKITIMETH